MSDEGGDQSSFEYSLISEFALTFMRRRFNACRRFNLHYFNVRDPGATPKLRVLYRERTRMNGGGSE